MSWTMSRSLTIVQEIPQQNGCCSLFQTIFGCIQHCFSGGASSPPTNLTLRYSPFLKKWKLLKNMIHARSHHAMIFFRNILFVFGGLLTSGLCTNACEKYSILDDDWLPIASFPDEAVTEAAVCIWEDKIALSGGKTNNGVSDKVWLYDPGTDGWCELGRMKSARHGHSMVVVGHQLYILGGEASTIECYDKCKQEFEVVYDKVLLKHHGFAVVLYNYIFVMDCQDEEHVIVFNTENNTLHVRHISIKCQNSNTTSISSPPLENVVVEDPEGIFDDMVTELPTKMSELTTKLFDAALLSEPARNRILAQATDEDKVDELLASLPYSEINETVFLDALQELGFDSLSKNIKQYSGQHEETYPELCHSEVLAEANQERLLSRVPSFYEEKEQEFLLLIAGQLDKDDPYSFVTNDVYSIDGTLQKQHPIPDIPADSETACIVSEKNGVYVIGAGRYRNALYKLDLNTLYWQKLQDLLESRRGHTCCVIGNKLYVVGGASTNTVEIYDVNRNKWCFGTPFPCISIEAAASCPLNGFLLVCGGAVTMEITLSEHEITCPYMKAGLEEEYISKALWSYKPEDHGENTEWMYTCSMIETRQDHSLVALKEKVFAVGGYEKPSVEMWIPGTASFTKITGLEIPRSVRTCPAIGLPESNRIVLVNTSAEQGSFVFICADEMRVHEQEIQVLHAHGKLTYAYKYRPIIRKLSELCNLVIQRDEGIRKREEDSTTTCTIC